MRPHPEQDIKRSSRLPAVFSVFLLLLIPAIVFSNSLRNDFHLDSVYRVKDNTEIKQFWPPWRFFIDRRTGSTIPQIAEYRPMMPLSLSLDAVIARNVGVDRLVGHRVGNIVIHAMTALAIYALFYQLLLLPLGGGGRSLGPAATAFIGALIFAVHPVSGVPVNYVAARDLLLMMLFLSAAMLLYVRMRRAGDTVPGWCCIFWPCCQSRTQ